MKKQLFIIIIFLVSTTLLFSQEYELKEIENFGENKGNLRMFLYNPTPNDTVAKAVVFALHGCGQTAESFNKLTDWAKVAEKNNFIVVFPQQKTGNNMTSCFNWFKEKDFSIERGENQSVMDMYSYLQNTTKVDTSRVFITGVSAGAAMSVAIAYTHPETFSGICSYAGGAYGLAKNAFQGFKMMGGKQNLSDSELKKIDYSNVSSFPKLIIIHGKKDHTVNYNNASLLIRQWHNTFNIEKEPTIEKNSQNNNYITKETYFKENKAAILFYSVDDLGHEYLVNPDGLGDNNGGKLNYLSKDIDFFATYEIAKEFGLITD